MKKNSLFILLCFYILFAKYKKCITKKAMHFFNLVQNCLFNPCGKLPAKE